MAKPDRAERLLSVYGRATGDIIFSDDPRRDAIIAEMEAIAASATPYEALKVIEWWGDDIDALARRLWRGARRVKP